jgi:hypothetical protein
VETYFGRIKSAIGDSELSGPLKAAVLAGISFNDYFGAGIIVINVPGPEKRLDRRGACLPTRRRFDSRSERHPHPGCRESFLTRSATLTKDRTVPVLATEIDPFQGSARRIT